MPELFTRFQFTSKRKRMSTIIQNCGLTEYGYDKRLHIKGAAEIILGCCSAYINEFGQKMFFTEETRK
jgi:magnesium-transporting ATPase (P-type)